MRAGNLLPLANSHDAHKTLQTRGMNRILIWLTRTIIALIGTLPLPLVARVGRVVGGLAFWLDARHRRVALRNITEAFHGAMDEKQVREVAKENFRRIGENYASAAKTATMSDLDLKPFFRIRNPEAIGGAAEHPRTSHVVAIGHFGNFELYARFSMYVGGFKSATTYRALPQPALNRLWQGLRERSGCVFFERRADSNALREAMGGEAMILGLLADQHAGTRGPWLPFMGRPASSSSAPAIFALRYRASLRTAICYRTSLAHWEIEIGPEIATRENGHPRPVETITREINAALEEAVRRDPANWFWVHNRWKDPPLAAPVPTPAPAEASVPPPTAPAPPPPAP